MDATSLVQAQSIPEVEMEEINSPPSAEEEGDEVRGKIERMKYAGGLLFLFEQLQYVVLMFFLQLNRLGFDLNFFTV